MYDPIIENILDGVFIVGTALIGCISIYELVHKAKQRRLNARR